ncbi:hypothetical protein TNIN_407251 [Trichonephila inaurata madagascariensis]|uniref:Uncharacterized protein n=1 Tax=Trichonephila inaurata madagascariensis TaxID=2747483 RepID=A0A8X6YGF1_9ARAC|nr:hypothetical protein TNIN_407251 [Trichonephila inaurata madagascariensis]
MQGSVSHSHLLHVNGAHTQPADQNLLGDPGYGSTVDSGTVAISTPCSVAPLGQTLQRFVPRAPAESKEPLSVKRWPLEAIPS